MNLSRQMIQLTSFLLFSLDTREYTSGRDYCVWYIIDNNGGNGFEHLSHNVGSFVCDDSISNNFTKYQWNKIKNLFR